MVVELIPNVEILEAPIHAHDFISPEQAAWCAIRSLLFSHIAGADFQSMYQGELALRATDHALSQGNVPWRMLGKPIWEFETQKRFAMVVKAQYEADLRENLPMVKAVLGLVYVKRMGLNQALEAVEKFNRSKAHEHTKADDHELAKRFSGKGAGTLRKQWVRFRKAMPFVLAEFIRENSPGETLTIQQLSLMPMLWQDTALKRSSTKKIAVGSVYAIDFY